MKRYVYHSFSIVVPGFDNLFPLLPDLTSKIEHHSESFIDVARRYNSVIENMRESTFQVRSRTFIFLVV